MFRNWSFVGILFPDSYSQYFVIPSGYCQWNIYSCFHLFCIGRIYCADREQDSIWHSKIYNYNSTGRSISFFSKSIVPFTLAFIIWNFSFNCLFLATLYTTNSLYSFFIQSSETWRGLSVKEIWRRILSLFIKSKTMDLNKCFGIIIVYFKTRINKSLHLATTARLRRSFAAGELNVRHKKEPTYTWKNFTI